MQSERRCTQNPLEKKRKYLSCHFGSRPGAVVPSYVVAFSPQDPADISAMLKRPASSRISHSAVQKKPAIDRRCWSCVAGGFGNWSSVAQTNTNLSQPGCCLSCSSSRTCACGAFNDDREAAWCKACHQYLAKWCQKCNSTADLQSGLYVRCSQIAVLEATINKGIAL